MTFQNSQSIDLQTGGRVIAVKVCQWVKVLHYHLREVNQYTYLTLTLGEKNEIAMKQMYNEISF